MSIWAEMTVADGSEATTGFFLAGAAGLLTAEAGVLATAAALAEAAGTLARAAGALLESVVALVAGLGTALGAGVLSGDFFMVDRGFG